MGEGFFGQRKARGIADFTRGFDFRQHGGVVGRVGNDAYAARCIAVIFGRGAHHGGAANVDVLDRLVERHVGLGHGLAKGVEVHHHQVNRRNAVRFHGRQVRGQVAPPENAAVHLGVQGFHAAIEHFRKTGVIGDIRHGQPRIAQQFGRAPRGEQRDAKLRKAPGKFDNACFIGNADERLSDFH